MGLFDRIAFITRSKANALLDDLEDPVQAINQTIEDASREYAQVKAAAAQVIAGETQAKNTLKEYEDTIRQQRMLFSREMMHLQPLRWIRQLSTRLLLILGKLKWLMLPKMPTLCAIS